MDNTNNYLLYLRKSRQDDPNETVEEVLSKHEIMLQEYMVREFGFKIPESNIYREVCSGESIKDRVEIKKSSIENGRFGNQRYSGYRTAKTITRRFN